MENRAKLIAFQTLVTKEIRRFMRIWVQTLVPPAITVMLYFIIFGNLIGSRIGQMGGYTYMEFVVPGLIMMGVITNSYSNVVSSFFNARFQRHVEELLVSPVPHYIILLGYVAGGRGPGSGGGLYRHHTGHFFRRPEYLQYRYYDIYCGNDFGIVLPVWIYQCHVCRVV